MRPVRGYAILIVAIAIRVPIDEFLLGERE